jgi:hypothetical protein
MNGTMIKDTNVSEFSLPKMNVGPINASYGY